MAVLIYFLAALALAQALPASSPFVAPEDLDDRIIQGWPAAPGQFPHIVHLRMVTTTGGLNACGGIIIHPSWILTAAHCLTSKTAVFVRYGATNVTEPALILESTNFTIHPNYSSSNLNHDIGLINVGRWVQSTDKIKPVRMPGRPTANATFTGMTATAKGFGRTTNTGPASEILNYVNLTVISNEVCGSFYGIVINSTLCTVGIQSPAQSPCSGDSGSPLVIYEQDGLPTVVGVTSFVSSAGCDANAPAGYVRPHYYHDWITSVTGISFA